MYSKPGCQSRIIWQNSRCTRHTSSNLFTNRIKFCSNDCCHCRVNHTRNFHISRNTFYNRISNKEVITIYYHMNILSIMENSGTKGITLCIYYEINTGIIINGCRRNRNSSYPAIIIIRISIFNYCRSSIANSCNRIYPYLFYVCLILSINIYFKNSRNTLSKIIPYCLPIR
ncbi:MAG: hypothetical protein BWY18_00848 [Candidatus Cloacimonetes bacterium ADurb.Bin211]|nr:MAG: hypothetical protein BWY18_00848 [Candidatus Cloacimonetes bacterium ADurb.Bin211]